MCVFLIVFLIVYIIMWIIVSTLSLISFFEDNYCLDGEDICFYALFSLGKGIIWPISIWVALAIWVAKKETPYWAEILVKLFNFCRGKKQK